MSANTIEMKGTLQADGKLILDKKPALPPGRVRVALRAIENESAPGADVLVVLQRIRAAQDARSYVPRARAQRSTRPSTTCAARTKNVCRRSSGCLRNANGPAPRSPHDRLSRF